MAIWVVIAHWINFMGFDVTGIPLRFLANGSAAVEVFIMLSGFVIFLLLDRRKNTYLNFITQRFFRLFPVYLFCLFIAVISLNFSIEVLHSIEWFSSGNESRLLKFQASNNQLSLHFFTHLFMLHGLFDNILEWSSFTFLSPMWSISLEWQFYLIAPMLFGCFKRSTSILISSLIICSFLYLKSWYGANAFFFSYYPSFLVGMFSYWLWKSRKIILTNNKFNAQSVVLSIPIIILLLTKNISLFIWSFTLCMTAYNENKAHLNNISGFYNKLLRLRLLTFLGDISYSIYLVHMLIIYPLLYMFIRYDFSLGFIRLYSLPIFLFVTISFAFLMHKFIEIPGIKLGKKFIKKSI